MTEFERPSSDQEKQIVDLLLPFAADPLGFVLANYPWGEPNTPLADIKGPREWQREELSRLGDAMRDALFAKDNGLPYDVFRAAFSSGRGPGKSAFAGMVANWHVSTHIGAHTIVAANTETQLRTKTFPEIARWFTFGLNRHWFTVEGMLIRPAPWFGEMVATQLRVDPKYWGVFGQNWQPDNPDSFAGAHVPYGMMVMFDEASGIADGVWTVTEGFFIEPNPSAYRGWFAFSQMRRPSGRFYDLFYDRDGKGSGWHARTMDISDPRYGMNTEEIQKFIARYGTDSDAVRVEIRGLPPKQGDKQFIDTNAVREAQTRTLLADKDAPLVMGVDPAPRGRTAIRFRQGPDARTIQPIILEGKDNIQIADMVVQLVNHYNPDAVVVDAGNGTGVIDILKRRRVKVHEVWMGWAATKAEWATMGTELWARLRDWLPLGCIDASPELFRDLTKREWRWHGREEKCRILEPKKNLAARGIPSPDDADALCLTFFVNPPRRDRSATRGRQRVVIAEGVEKSLFGDL